MNEDTLRKIEALRQGNPKAQEQSGEALLRHVVAPQERTEGAFHPDYDAHEHADQVKEMIKPDTHREAVVEMPVKIAEKDQPAELSKLINPTTRTQELMAQAQSGKADFYSVQDEFDEAYRNHQKAA